VAEIDLRKIRKAEYEFDPVGHDSQPDAFSLSANKTVRLPVRYREDRKP
jgi:hypothetical protein